MMHFNFSSDWEVRTTNSGRSIFSPVPADNREYNPQTDIAIHGSVRPISNRKQKFLSYSYDKVANFDKDGYLSEKEISDKSHTLLKSFPKGRFTVVSSSKYPIKIRGREDKTKSTLLTLSLSESSITFKEKNVLANFAYNGKRHFAIILNDREEVNIFDFGKDDSYLHQKAFAYVFKDGHLEEHVITF